MPDNQRWHVEPYDPELDDPPEDYELHKHDEEDDG